MGLLPGTGITCYYFLFKYSRSGNPYCTTSPFSDIALIPSITPSLPMGTAVTTLNELLYRLHNGTLSTHNNAIVQGTIVAVQNVTIKYQQYPNPVYTATARYICTVIN